MADGNGEFLKELREWKGETTQSLKGLHEKMDDFKSTITTHIKDDDKHFASIYQKVNKIDKSATKLVAYAAAMLFIATIFGNRVLDYFFK